MNFKRFSLMVLAAALTAGTSTAAPVIFNGYVSPSGQQFLSVTIDGFLIGSGTSAGLGVSQVFTNNLEEVDGWHTISIDYKNFFGPNAMTFTVNFGWAAFADLQSLDATNTPIYGLRGDYFTSSGDPIKTDYGEPGLGGYLNYAGGAAQWSGTAGSFNFTSNALFEERLTGQIYFGPNAAPPLDPVTPPGGGGGGGSDGGGGDGSTDVPESSGLWLVAAGLPLMLLSKHRSRAVSIR